MGLRNLCSCKLAVGHSLGCPLRNEGLRTDFSDLKGVWAKIAKDYSGPGRNPARIREILRRLERIWLENSDLRLGQLMLNFFIDNCEVYYLEDKELIERLEGMYFRKRKKNRR